MSDERAPHWLLLSVLFSSVPLTPAVAWALHRTAYEMYCAHEGARRLQGSLMGEVRSLGRDALLGTMGGPEFEADVETERERGRVWFFLTHKGIERLAEGADPKAMN